MTPAELAEAYTAKHGEHPISRLYGRIEGSKARAARLDTRTRQPIDESDRFAVVDWEHDYRQMRRERAAVTRRLKAIRRIDATLGRDVSGLRPIEGRTLWGNPTTKES
jgi:hypothetical protein